ncbi:MAG: DNA mismatch repair protein MutS [bacterium]|nr:DNA mismatch repair protein MutS [bacterium]
MLSNARLIVFGVGLIFVWLSLSRELFSAWWLALPVALFVALVLRHDSARRNHLRAERAVAHYEAGLARLDYRFTGTGKSGERYASPEHPYTGHLDLFGSGSIYELLCRAQTRAGEDRLAAWLSGPAAPDEIRARQGAVKELRDRLDLREDMAVLGPEVVAGLHPDPLVEWGTAERVLPGGPARGLAMALSAGMFGALAASIFGGIGLGPLFGVLAIQGVFGLILRKRVSAVLHDVERPATDLGLLYALLERIEPENFESPMLAELRATLDTEGLPPSAQVARLNRLITLLDARRNQMFAPLSPFLLWGTHLAYAIETWRSHCGRRLAPWIEAVGTLEALDDLAGHAFEHPDDAFPKIVDAGPYYDAHDLGHPLLPEQRCVRNDVRLDGELSLIVISGSNMSGKSTLLRSIGSSVAMGLAGAPVRARDLTLSPLALGASLRIQDSIQDGTSRFYAEITCLQRVVELREGPIPLLFMLDEILQGTNSHDRRIGASEVVAGLVEHGSIGLITTHDLALTEMVGRIGSRARNVHFEDQLVDGKMVFDYTLREGVVTHSNALELMRAVGLEV